MPLILFKDVKDVSLKCWDCHSEGNKSFSLSTKECLTEPPVQGNGKQPNGYSLKNCSGHGPFCSQSITSKRYCYMMQYMHNIRITYI